MPSLLDSPPQVPATGGWGSLYSAHAQDPLKPRHVMAAAAKKPAYGGGRKKNLETCTEALGCETGAVDTTPAEAEAAECAERKRRAREEAEMEQRARRPLPPPLTTLAHGGGSRVRMVHERRDGRLSVYAVRTPGVEAERSGGRLRMRLLPLHPCIGAGNAAAAACHQESQEAEAKEEEKDVKEAEEEENGVAKYVRGGRCVEPEGVAAAASRLGSKQWEPEQAAAFWVATS
ncbi:unnamed protein product [Urochloa humidicola]